MSAKPPPLPTCRKRTAEPDSPWADDEASQPPPLPPSARPAEQVRIVPDDAPRSQLTRWSGAMVPWIASFLFHQALLLGLAFWMISAMAGSGGPPALLTAGNADLEGETLESSVFASQTLYGYSGVASEDFGSPAVISMSTSCEIMPGSSNSTFPSRSR